MRSSAFVVVFGVLASLTNAATYYRGDTRGPKALKAAEGFKARGFTNPEGTLFEHVEGTLKHPMRDPFISTTSDESYAKEHNGKGYVYSIDEITDKIHDVAKEYEKAGKKYGHAKEKEFAVEHHIPFKAIKKAQKYNETEKKWKDVKMPAKRDIEMLFSA
ncbi:ADP-ribosylation [Ophiobolus disseminans]|uniref:ADP-ribosylation n=1 Tax=Ophiobolus disseminans TaxID=1469910 RepID=A0A6A6ZBV1_9PLEO|nr:ADP-ribosylation [Ophiobolus disseminans]